MSHEQNVPQQHNTPPFPQTGPEVNIIINAAPKEIHRGHRTVIELKDVGGIPQADELNQIIDGKLVPLADDGAMTIKGGEEFVSHPRTGGSS